MVCIRLTHAAVVSGDGALVNHNSPQRTVGRGSGEVGDVRVVQRFEGNPLRAGQSHRFDESAHLRRARAVINAHTDERTAPPAHTAPPM